MSDNHGIFSDVRIVDGVVTLVETEKFAEGDIASIETLVEIPDPDDEDVEITISVTENDIIEEIILPE